MNRLDKRVIAMFMKQVLRMLGRLCVRNNLPYDNEDVIQLIDDWGKS